MQDNEMHKILWDFEIQTDHPIPTKRPNPVLINKKKTFQVEFAVPARRRVSIKESGKLDEYSDLARERKTLLKTKVPVILFVVSAFLTVHKGLTKSLEIRGRIDNI